jgi:hypothetical protein
LSGGSGRSYKACCGVEGGSMGCPLVSTAGLEFLVTQIRGISSQERLEGYG